MLTRSAKRLLVIAAASVAMHTFLASAAQATETPPSASASVYVYWSYWDQPSPGTWLPSATGAGAQTPPDGSVIGWRYGVGSVDGTHQTPRTQTSLPAASNHRPPRLVAPRSRPRAVRSK